MKEVIKKLDILEIKFDTKFASLEAKFASLEAKFESINTNISNIKWLIVISISIIGVIIGVLQFFG